MSDRQTLLFDHVFIVIALSSRLRRVSLTGMTIIVIYFCDHAILVMAKSFGRLVQSDVISMA